MINEFQHQINTTKHFMEQLEIALHAYEQEIKDLKLKNARHALERGKLLQRLSKYEEIPDDGLTYTKRTKKELRELAIKEVQRQKDNKEYYLNQNMIAESDATGVPRLEE